MDPRAHVAHSLAVVICHIHLRVFVTPLDDDDDVNERVLKLIETGPGRRRRCARFRVRSLSHSGCDEVRGGHIGDPRSESTRGTGTGKAGQADGLRLTFECLSVLLFGMLCYVPSSCSCRWRARLAHVVWGRTDEQLESLHDLALEVRDARPETTVPKVLVHICTRSSIQPSKDLVTYYSKFLERSIRYDAVREKKGKKVVKGYSPTMGIKRARRV